MPRPAFGNKPADASSAPFWNNRSNTFRCSAGLGQHTLTLTARRALLRAIDGYEGEPVTRAALRLAPLDFVRPGELRAAEWPEFDLDEAMSRIPAARMKMKANHLVPLSKQAIAILRDLQPFTERDRSGTERRFVGFYEEVVARGFLLARCRVLLHTRWAAVLLSSLLFGLAHLYQGWGGVVLTAIVGAVFAGITLRWGTLWPVILAHAGLKLSTPVALDRFADQ